MICHVEGHRQRHRLPRQGNAEQHRFCGSEFGVMGHNRHSVKRIR